jgi:ATP-dependent helicase HrpA
MIADVQGFRRRLKRVSDHNDKQQNNKQKLAELEKHIEKSIATAEERKKKLPIITYPDDLPIAQKSELIKKIICENQVTILCGETGSGKTTQLPKYVLILDWVFAEK